MKMTSKQLLHVGMVNSFNVITNKNTFEEILDSDVAVFVHVPDKEIPLDIIHYIMDYFEGCEMFEYCSELYDFVSDNYNEDGTLREDLCQCNYPLVLGYKGAIRCGLCNNIIRK
jgi:hypothetical protein